MFMKGVGVMGRSIKRSPFVRTVSRTERRKAGRTAATKTPLALRASRVDVDPDFVERIEQRLGLRLGKFALHIERLTVRFEDVNGPRGGRDVACKIKVVISGLPSIVVTELARSAPEAFNRADGRVERAVRDAIDRARDRGTLEAVRPRRVSGARTTRAKGARASTAPRNFTRRPRKATVALEDTAPRSRPSRKSTRGSSNRAKHANKLARREQRRVSSPKAKRARAGR
jgi:hypothetical protein